MSIIYLVSENEPNFPPSDQHPDANRYFVDGHYVDSIGEPTELEVRQITVKGNIQAQIDQIERQTLMNRVTREFLLAMAEAQAQGQGVTKEQLYQINLGYRRTKDVDTQIAQLRAQL